MADAWNTTAMADALPKGDKGTESHPAPAAAGTGPHETKAQAAGWVKPQSYNYEALSKRDLDWESNAETYEWDGQVGDIGPEVESLEKELFGPNPDKVTPTGIDFAKVTSIQLIQEGPIRIEPIMKFDDFKFHPAMAKNIQLSGYMVPTPIQKYTIPAISKGYDVIGIAQTGSGKTAAYLIPIINKIMGKAKKLAGPRPQPIAGEGAETMLSRVRADPLVVIVVPTRELAIQIWNEARKLCYRSMLRPCVMYGGGPIPEQARQLEKGCDILVATPGRLKDFMDRTQTLSLSRVRYMVIDEADEMLQEDWKQDFQKILSGGEQDEGNIKYCLFSATFPKPLRDLAKEHLTEDHVRFRVGRAGSTVSNIKQDILDVEGKDKYKLLVDVLEGNPPGRTIVFVNAKRMADSIDDYLYNLGFPCTAMHGDRTQHEREDAMRAFRSGRAPILVATGVSARGIDVPNVKHVINFDLPSSQYGGIEEYTHRIGRTGRIGNPGLATSFYTERDQDLGSVLTRIMLEAGQEIPAFLQQYVPEGDAINHLQFEADSDFDPTDMPGAGESFDGGGFDGFNAGWEGDNMEAADDEANIANSTAGSYTGGDNTEPAGGDGNWGGGGAEGQGW